MSTDQPLTLKQKAIAFLELVVSNKVREAYQQYVGADFKHHNAYFKGDAESLMKGMEENATQSPNKIMEVKLAIQENDTVAVYSHMRQNSDDAQGVALVHIFRFKDGQIVELWDLGQPVPAEMVNENGMF